MNDKSQVEYMLNDIRAIVDNLIIKLTYLADKYETTSMRRESDRYIAAYLERDNFNSYKEYPMDVIVNAGITDINEIMACVADKNKIPRNKRKEVLKYMRELVINEYVERNDYYRELIGKPPLNSPESEWFYLTEEEMEYYDIDEVRPIHDYPNEIQIKLERAIIPRLIKENPEKTYLKHMGSKAVNLVRAREAKNFEIIFTDIQLDNVFLRAFFETYDFCREYFMSMIYNKHLKSRYDLYDNFLGMHIMIMTIQRLIVDTIKMGIDRDFYDLISIQKLFNVYGLPFYEDLPLDYQRMIAKNLNWLLRCKSTDKVLYDVANTLFYERVRIYKYFLVKERKFDDNNEPVFEYKSEPVDYVSTVVLISDKSVYKIGVENGELVTFKIGTHVYAPKYLYIRDGKTDERIRLFMEEDRLIAEIINDEDIACQKLYLYDENENKYMVFHENGKLMVEMVDREIVTTYDYEKMFDVYFQATDIMEKNVITTIETKANRYGYDEMVDDDVYWWETEELKKELYEREYNYIDTKFISITLMQNLTNLIYETCYYLNLIIDHKDTTVPEYFRIFNTDAMKTGTDYLYLTLDRISSTPVSIFDTVMILCALVSKKNGMKGNIIAKSPSKILSVLGFNFELNFGLIKENIKKYKRIFKNQEIVKYLDLLDIQTVEDIDTLYTNFRNFAEFCEEVIANTNDINEYKAYKELYKVFTVREDTTNAFTMSNGEIATTYLEYLYDRVPNIAEFISTLHKDKTGIYIEHVIGKLNELVPEIEYLSSLNGTNNNIVDAIIGLINFFKSYTVDLRQLNVMYMFDNKRMNKIFMIDDPRLFITLYPEEKNLTYNDNLKYYVGFDKSDNLIIYDKGRLFNRIYHGDDIIMNNTINRLFKNMQYNDTLELNYKDTVELLNIMVKSDVIDLKTFIHLINKIYHNEKDLFKESYAIKISLSYFDSINMDYKDTIILLAKLVKDEIIDFKFFYNMYVKLCYKKKFITTDKYSMDILLEKLDKMELDYKDMLEIIDSIQYNENSLISFFYFMTIKLFKNERNIVNDKYLITTTHDVLDKIEINYKDVCEVTIDEKYDEQLKILFESYVSNIINYNNKITIRDSIKIFYED